MSLWRRRGKDIQPKRKWVKDIVERVRENDIPVFIKKSITEHRYIQEYPE
jgi:hypothetical protein